MITLTFACSEQKITNTTTPVLVEKEENKIFIKDVTGKRWDITHAVNHYGFEPGLFDGGGGPYLIEPIIDPVMLDPGDPRYPKSTDEQVVIGNSSGADSRAYSLHIMSLVEIANDVVDSRYVAAAY